MNKRFIYIAVIIAILFTICLSEQLLVSNYLGNMKTKISAVVESVAETDDINTPEIYDSILNIEKTWNRYEANLCFFVNLKDIEDIGIELTKMKVYIVENSVEDFKASLSLLLYYIDGYDNLIGISFENIF